MLIRADYTQRVVVRPDDSPWVASPAAGVERRLLDRIGGEVARATSLVRYAPGSRFEAHTHGGGEEFLVLDGVFADENGDYPPGSYVRNPPVSAHAPRSETGCTLFVKLHQFAVQDTAALVIDTRNAPWHPGLVEGLSVQPLHNHNSEQVALVRWAPGTRFREHQHWGGEEILVLEGTFEDEHGRYPAGSWLRNPHGSRHTPFSTDGCTIYVKTGHLLAEHFAGWPDAIV
ncbi:MAG: cupin domain-containing protein [Gammaproteobacteria bacterium]